MDEIWIEKYRPKKRDEVVGHSVVVERLKSYIKQPHIPHPPVAEPTPCSVHPATAAGGRANITRPRASNCCSPPESVPAN